MPLSRCLPLLILFLALLGVGPLAAEPLVPEPEDTEEEAEEPARPPIDAALLARLRQGGYLIFFRHGLTPNYADPGGDPALGNCATQRNLSKEGIEQAKALGEAFRALEIPIGILRSSPYCRCMDTAWLAFGRAERDMNLRLAGTNPAIDHEEAKRWKGIRTLARIAPLPGTNSIYMSHGTVGEIFGAGDLAEGEAVIVEPDGRGAATLIGRVKSDQWRER